MHDLVMTQRSKPPRELLALLTFLALVGAPLACADRPVDIDDEADTDEPSPFEPGEQYADCVEGFECVNEWCLSPVDEPGFCTITCASVDDCEFPDVGEALPTCLAVGGESACALDCDDGRECPSGMRCEQVDAGGERWICF